MDCSTPPCITSMLIKTPMKNPLPQVRIVKLLSHVWLFATPWTVAYQVPPSIGFFRKGYWSGLPFPSPGDLADPGIKPRSSALQTDALPSEPPGRPRWPFSHRLKHLQRIWAAEDGGKREYSYTLSEGVNWCRNYQKQQGGSLSAKHPENTWPDNPRSGLRSRKKSEFTVTHAPLFSGKLHWQ